MNEKNLTKKINTPCSGKKAAAKGAFAVSKCTETEPTRLITRRIGSVVYEVNISFNSNAKETLNNKLNRLIKNDLEAV